MKPTLTTDDFISKVQPIIDELKEKGIHKKDFSDVVDDEGNQYVDLVQEGGGTLGIALVGYLYVLEQMGIRFLSLGGASAGAISTILLASLGKPNEMKSIEILDIVTKENFYSFVDGGIFSKWLIKSLIKGHSIVIIIFKLLFCLPNLTKKYGLNPGKHFHDWLTGILNKQEIEDYNDLYKKISNVRVHFKKGISPYKKSFEPKLALMAVDITTNTKVEFPRMGCLYYQNLNSANPADFVRASMSIPLFFEPFEIPNIPKGMTERPEAPTDWKRQKYEGDTPEKVWMVDGGIKSNFPIDVFHKWDEIPSRPTFGAKLGLDRTKPTLFKNVLSLIYGCFNAASSTRDLDAQLKNDELKYLVCYIDTGDHSWIKFNLSPEEKLELFLSGAYAAKQFLLSFNWKRYQNLRKNLLVKQFADIFWNADDDLRRTAIKA